MYEMMSEAIFQLLLQHPERYAQVTGGEKYPGIGGMVLFYRYKKGTVVVADIMGLPDNGTGIFGFHIHEGLNCDELGMVPFAGTKGHFNPYGREHPMHAGDMPVLLGDGGKAWGAFFTERFMPGEVTGRTVVIHDMPDDYRTQPAGDSGEKIACGIIY